MTPRRLATVLATVVVGGLGLTACKHDGRTMRPPTFPPPETTTTTIAPTVPADPFDPGTGEG